MADEVKAASEALAVATTAVSGAETPNDARVASDPAKGTALMLVLAGPAVSIMVMTNIGILAFKLWPEARAWNRPELGDRIVQSLAITNVLLAALLGVIVWRLASGGLRSVSVHALGSSIDVQSGDADDKT